MTKSNSFREGVVKRKRKVSDKVNSCRENFKKKEKEMSTDLEEAGRIWGELSKRFKWWQSLP